MELSAEEKLQRMILELKVLEAYYNELTAKETLLARAILDSRATAEALKSVPEGSDSEILVPIGAGVLMKIQSPKTDRLLLNLGAGVVVERNKEDVLNYLNTRINELETALSSIGAQKSELENKINAQRAEVNNLAARLQTG